MSKKRVDDDDALLIEDCGGVNFTKGIHPISPNIPTSGDNKCIDPQAKKVTGFACALSQSSLSSQESSCGNPISFANRDCSDEHRDRFPFSIPTPCFDRSNVRGLLCERATLLLSAAVWLHVREYCSFIDVVAETTTFGLHPRDMIHYVPKSLLLSLYYWLT
jgi:hypothetical protein